MTIEAQAAILTKIQNAIKDAKDADTLQRHVGPMLDTAEFYTLDNLVQEDLIHQFNVRSLRLSGALVG